MKTYQENGKWVLKLLSDDDEVIHFNLANCYEDNWSEDPIYAADWEKWLVDIIVPGCEVEYLSDYINETEYTLIRFDTEQDLIAFQTSWS